jgi:ElaA protein
MQARTRNCQGCVRASVRPSPRITGRRQARLLSSLVTTTLHSATPRDLAAVTMYRILELRVDVFVVEQNCPYHELDGRDLEPDAVWVWAEDDGEILATLRIVHDTDGRARIGRVATAPAARSAGTASRLMQCALDQIAPGAEVLLDAQSYLEGWYARFGFVRGGSEFVEDGIPHVPMVLGARR